jgi:hypothetical protein
VWTAYDKDGVVTELKTGDRLVAVSTSLTQPDVTFPRKRGLQNLAIFSRDEGSDQVLLQFNQDFSEMHFKKGGEFDASGTWVLHNATGWVPRLLAPAATEVNDLAALSGDAGDDLADLEISGEEELEAGDDLGPRKGEGTAARCSKSGNSQARSTPPPPPPDEETGEVDPPFLCLARNRWR